MIQKTFLVAVYGSLRKGMGNHEYYLSKAEHVGTYSTEPEYSLYSLEFYPGLKLNGNHSIVMEVYKVNLSQLKSLNQLEGYYPGEKATFYDRINIETPWGKAYTYIYVNDLSRSPLVESGDWVEYKNNKNNKK